MKSLLATLLLLFSFSVFAQDTSDKAQIETTLNNYLDGFYKGDTLKLKAALKPRLYKFGYWKNKESGEYEYYDQMTYDKAIDFAKRIKKNNQQKGDDVIRKAEVLEISNHIAAAKVIGFWGVDYMLLSKEGGKWMIEQVIWEGPLEKTHLGKTTTYYLIRHAEKDTSDKEDKDPHLSEAGKTRADKWAKHFEGIALDAVYSTNYNRTKETATPTAKSKNLELTFYDPRNMDAKEFMAQTEGKTVLIVGHSNTTPMFTNAILGKKKYEMMQEDDNASLYKVTVTEDAKTSELLKIN
ncbi:histidine phosphatase family protein [Winogradskyella sp. MIT101101]|uniref:histidine phosphatase family protein n=1 Tax=Winogradskyella sp. MIT101101 TaxID=3098297 RepID=UPI00399AF954